MTASWLEQPQEEMPQGYVDMLPFLEKTKSGEPDRLHLIFHEHMTPRAEVKFNLHLSFQRKHQEPAIVVVSFFEVNRDKSVDIGFQVVFNKQTNQTLELMEAFRNPVQLYVDNYRVPRYRLTGKQKGVKIWARSEYPLEEWRLQVK